MKFSLLSKLSLSALFVSILTACQVNAGDTSRQVTGSDVGQIFVYSPVNEVAAVSFNERFITSLQQQQQFSQKVCAGNYQLKVRSVAPATNQFNQVQRYIGTLPIQVERDQNYYFELNRTAQGWDILPLSEQEWASKAKGRPNPKLVRRLSDAMIRCK